VSFTVTVNVHVAVLPAPSVAVHVTVVAPFGKEEPDAGLQITPGVEQLSVALAAEYVTVAAQVLAAVETVMFAGQVMTGGEESTTVTLAEH
jgi:hypothetical protein